MSEEFRPRDWLSIYALLMDISQYIPAGIGIPFAADFIIWAHARQIPATCTVTCGWMIRKKDLPAIAETVIRLRGKKPS
jgi:hypothetical protein